MAIIISNKQCLLEFGGDIGVGTTSVIHKKTNDKCVSVSFDNLNERMEIGSESGKVTSSGNIVFMIFSKVESIDVVIKKLNEAREKLELIKQED